MKRCPACSKTYDDASAFCSVDAQALVSLEADTPAVKGPKSDTRQVKEIKDTPATPAKISSDGKEKEKDPFLGKTLNNKFRIDAMLGRGGMGAVYRATDIVLDRIVAVKLLRHDLLGDENLDSRFLRE